MISVFQQLIQNMNKRVNESEESDLKVDLFVMLQISFKNW